MEEDNKMKKRMEKITEDFIKKIFLRALRIASDEVDPLTKGEEREKLATSVAEELGIKRHDSFFLIYLIV